MSLFTDDAARLLACGSPVPRFVTTGAAAKRWRHASTCARVSFGSSIAAILSEFTRRRKRAAMSSAHLSPFAKRTLATYSSHAWRTVNVSILPPRPTCWNQASAAFLAWSKRVWAGEPPKSPKLRRVCFCVAGSYT